ncbi:MAG: DedA family protein, partial [Patescibacteria group bacterium]|nr:DedA family protein [Patescibacteria group bacterium]
MSLLPHLDIEALLLAGGYVGLFCIVFAETGLFFGFFFPGDSLLFTAGLLAAAGTLNLWAL